MSTSLVIVGEPQRRPATPPITTKHTPCRCKALSAPIGSNTISVHPPGAAEAIHRRSLFHERRDPLRGGECEQLSDACAVDARSGPWNSVDGLVADEQQALERANAWVVLAPFDPGDRGLGHASSCREGPLGQPGAPSSLLERPACHHGTMIAYRLSNCLGPSHDLEVVLSESRARPAARLRGLA